MGYFKPYNVGDVVWLKSHKDGLYVGPVTVVRNVGMMSINGEYMWNYEVMIPLPPKNILYVDNRSLMDV